MAKSLLTRGAWIEMISRVYLARHQRSLLTRGAWIEIALVMYWSLLELVAPHPRSVD